MQHTRKIFLALPRHPDVHNATQNALSDTARRPELENFVTTRDICQAEVVITDTPTVNFDLTTLPETVRYLQIIDCGSGEPHTTDDALTIANASSILAESAADNAIQLWQEATSHSQPTGTVVGIIGFGTLGYEIGKQLSQLDTQIWINDIRTPRQQSFQQIGARRSSLDMLLSTSHIIFIAIHPGPTSNPLLTHRELRLLTTNSTIINLSGPQVIDKTAIQTLNTTQARAINYHESLGFPPLTGEMSEGQRGPAAMPQSTRVSPVNGGNVRRTKGAPNPETQTITRYILANLTNYALNQQPRSIVEQVTHPKAGDPAFWASRMHPRQTPV